MLHKPRYLESGVTQAEQQVQKKQPGFRSAKTGAIASAFFAVWFFVFNSELTAISSGLASVGLAFRHLANRRLEAIDDWSAQNRQDQLIKLFDVLSVVLLISATVVVAGPKVRQLAPIVNRVLPHLLLQASHERTAKRLGTQVAPAGAVFKVFEVTVQSRNFARDYVTDYNFGLQIDNDVYEAFDDPNLYSDRRDLPNGCDIDEVYKNVLVMCLVAFEVPTATTKATVVYDSSDYKAWADITFSP